MFLIFVLNFWFWQAVISNQLYVNYKKYQDKLLQTLETQLYMAIQHCQTNGNVIIGILNFH